SLGGGLPRRTLMVSPQHHKLFGGPVVQEMFGEREVLALAKALVGLKHIRTMNGRRAVTYYSLLCARHEVIMADGAWSESFYPGPTALTMIRPHLRREIEDLFPALRTDPKTGYGPKVRMCLTRKETEALANDLCARGLERADDETATWNREAAHHEWDQDLADEQAASVKRSQHLRLVS
ncbi:MAG: Hint domain-containing protein, partial [Pseudomonadota bacterium]